VQLPDTVSVNQCLLNLVYNILMPKNRYRVVTSITARKHTKSYLPGSTATTILVHSEQRHRNSEQVT